MPVPVNPAAGVQALQGATAASQNTDVLNSELSADMISKYNSNKQPQAAQAQQAQPPIQSPQDAVPSPQPQQSIRPQPKGVTMTPVVSSNVKMVGYDPKTSELHVQFKSGPQTYIHSGVEPAKFMEFMNAKHKGLYYSSTFKGQTHKYPFRKVMPTPPQL